MESQDKFLHYTSPSRSQADTVIELSGTTTGEPPSPSPSPSLEPSDSAVTRRRSWGNRFKEAAKRSLEPVHLDFDMPAQSTSPRNFSAKTSAMPTDGRGYMFVDEPLNGNSERYFRRAKILDSNSPVGSSTVSLIASPFNSEHDTDESIREDDLAHLTSNMSHADMREGDLEYEGAKSPHARGKTLQYNVPVSPLKTTETVVKSVTKNLRRMSLRVVNLANNGLEGQLRLGDDETNKNSASTTDEDSPMQPDLKQIFPIRGRALGFLGPENTIRLLLFKFLVHPYAHFLPLSRWPLAHRIIV